MFLGQDLCSLQDVFQFAHVSRPVVSDECCKRFRLKLAGLGEVPAHYVGTVKDCLIQMLRNAAVHGIESPEIRQALTKEDVGVVSVAFHKAGEGFELVTW